jgi:hypothetical protein
MMSETRGKSRLSFVALTEVLDLRSNTSLKGRTTDLSLAGCFVDTLNPLPLTTDVHVQLTHKNETFRALGVVVHSQESLGMGIKFTAIEVEQGSVLDGWLADMR